MTETEYRVAAGEDPELGIRRAFERCRRLQADALRLVFPLQVRLSPTMTQTLLDELAQGAIERLALVHPSPALGFIASTLRLRFPRVAIEVLTPKASILPPPPASEQPRQSTRAQRQVAVGLLISARPGEPLEAFLGRACSEIVQRELSRVTLELDASQRLVHSAVKQLADALADAHSLVRMELVHPSPGLGFFASSLALRCPSVEVTTRRSLD